MKRLIYFFTLFTFFTLLSSHEFWLYPHKFIYKRAEKINIRFWVGENFDGGNWTGNNERINSLKLYYGGVSDDLSPVVTLSLIHISEPTDRQKSRMPSSA